MSDNEILIISKSLSDCPSKLCLLFMKTPDQLAYWLELKHYWTDLHTIATSYFTGTDPKLHDFPDKDYIEGLQVHWGYYQALYNVIFTGWDVLKTEAEKTNFPLPVSPGATLAEIFQREAFLVCLDCLLDDGWSPQVWHRKVRDCKNPQSDSIQKSFDYIQGKKRDLRLSIGSLESFCLKTLEKQTSKQMKRLTAVLLESIGELEVLALKITHPAKNPVGGSWKDGNFMPSTKGARHDPKNTQES
jgi:hypothetical protein